MTLILAYFIKCSSRFKPINARNYIEILKIIRFMIMITQFQPFSKRSEDP